MGPGDLLDPAALSGSAGGSMPTAITLVGANNFYVSCERVFQPRLTRRPVVVLSNNDGYVIARSTDYVESKVKSNL